VTPSEVKEKVRAEARSLNSSAVTAAATLSSDKDWTDAEHNKRFEFRHASQSASEAQVSPQHNPTPAPCAAAEEHGAVAGDEGSKRDGIEESKGQEEEEEKEEEEEAPQPGRHTSPWATAVNFVLQEGAHAQEDVLSPGLKFLTDTSYVDDDTEMSVHQVRPPLSCFALCTFLLKAYESGGACLLTRPVPHLRRRCPCCSKAAFRFPNACKSCRKC